MRENSTNLVWFALRALRVMIFWYIDDACVLGPTLEATNRSLAVVFGLLSFCGFRVNQAKSMRTGARRFSYLGLDFDLEAWFVRVQKKSVDKLVGLVERLRERTLWPCYRLRPILDSLIGLINFMEVVIQALRPLKHWLIGVRRAANRHEVFTLSATHRELLSLLGHIATSRNESPIWDREAELRKLHPHGVSTDACENGFGGWGRTSDGEVVFFHGLWSDLADLPEDLIIADKELIAHAMAVELLVPEVTPGTRAIDVQIDNKNAMGWVNHLRCHMSEGNHASFRRFRLLRSYFLMCSRLGLSVSASYVNTKLNVWADWLSRPDQVSAFYADVAASQCSVRRVSVPPGWFTAWAAAAG
jgi:hypothetical protein